MKKSRENCLMCGECAAVGQNETALAQLQNILDQEVENPGRAEECGINIRDVIKKMDEIKNIRFELLKCAGGENGWREVMSWFGFSQASF